MMTTCAIVQVPMTHMIHTPPLLPRIKRDTRYALSYRKLCRMSHSHQNFLATLTKVLKPKYLQEAAEDPHWRKAMAKEIEVLEKIDTWSIEELPSSKKPISCKWVYRVKYNADGSI